MNTPDLSRRAAPVVACARRIGAVLLRHLVAINVLLGGLTIGSVAGVHFGQTGQWVGSGLAVAGLLAAWLWANTVTISRVARNRVAYWDRRRARVEAEVEARREARDNRQLDAAHRRDFATLSDDYSTRFNILADVVAARRSLDNAAH